MQNWRLHFSQVCAKPPDSRSQVEFYLPLRKQFSLYKISTLEPLNLPAWESWVTQTPFTPWQGTALLHNTYPGRLGDAILVLSEQRLIPWQVCAFMLVLTKNTIFLQDYKVASNCDFFCLCLEHRFYKAGEKYNAYNPEQPVRLNHWS